MAELVPHHVIEKILLRLRPKDLIRCKSVCKSWQSIISSFLFVKAHLKHAYMIDRNNPELGHRWVSLPIPFDEESLYVLDCIYIVGSCDGLLCVSPDVLEVVVTNPSTREHRKLPPPPYRPHRIPSISIDRETICWGFGYDSSADDYKVIVGFMRRKRTGSIVTNFHVLTLKSAIWKVIGQLKYRITGRFACSGILCGRALHWYMKKKYKKTVIISLDLSTEEFKVIRLPGADLLFKFSYSHLLGVIEECLCIYTIDFPPSTKKKWVMKNNKWELYIDDHCQRKYDIVHYWPDEDTDYYVDDGTLVPFNGNHTRASFVESLVSPHPHDNNNHYEGQKWIKKEDTEIAESGSNNNIRKKKRSKYI
ncbi:F-box protein CPR1-like [Bidens hawaiensis]|uniref:F-box protein CPR1-like n=1 Tax=Bidens hawaiensis TaxID=980011 RepID=UPI00404907E0